MYGTEYKILMSPKWSWKCKSAEKVDVFKSEVITRSMRKIKHFCIVYQILSNWLDFLKNAIIHIIEENMNEFLYNLWVGKTYNHNSKSRNHMGINWWMWHKSSYDHHQHHHHHHNNSNNNIFMANKITIRKVKIQMRNWENICILEE